MKLKRFLTGVLSAVMALSVCALPAAADDANTTTTAPSTSTIDTGKKGSITIHKYVMTNVGDAKTSNNGETVGASGIPAGATAASGAKFTLYKVMAQDDLIKYYNGENATYKDKEPVYTDFVDDDSGTYTIKSDATVAGYTPVDATTDKNGLAKFGGLDIGLYVVIETETPKAVTKPVTPFLVSVPMTKVVTADSKQTATEWLYDIHVYPKNSTAVGEVTLKKMGAVGDKTDKSAAPLAGVQFKLEHLSDGADANDEDNWEHIKNENDGDYFTTADKTGVLTVKNLKPGTYRFTEIGYATGSENKFIINDGAKYVFEVTANDDGTVTVSKPSDAENNADYEAAKSQVTVYNYAPDVDKDVKDRVNGGYQQGADYAVGDTIEYKVKVVIPANRFLDGEVHGDAATHHQIQFALDQRQEIGHCLVADVIACRGEELSGQELFPVGDLGGVCRLHHDGIGLIVDAAEDHDTSGLATERTLHAGCTDLLCLVDIRFGTQMGRAALHDVQFHRTHLTSEGITHQLFQVLADARQVLMPEVVHQPGLHALRLPDLQDGTIVGTHAHGIDALTAGPGRAQTDGTGGGRLHGPHLRGAAHILPQVQPGAVGSGYFKRGLGTFISILVIICSLYGTSVLSKVMGTLNDMTGNKNVMEDKIVVYVTTVAQKNVCLPMRPSTR